eukprot:492454_1
MLILQLFMISNLLFCIHGSIQRGLAFSTQYCNDPIILNVSWYYNWNYIDFCANQTNIAWIPMISGLDEMQYITLFDNTNYDALLGFNEPDNHDQITVEQALDVWPQFMNTGLRLGSPASGQNHAFSWTKQFMNGIQERGYRVDFLCFHWYSYEWGINKTLPIQALDTFLQNISTQYPGYKIWITEFANITGSPNDNVMFFNQAYDLFVNKYKNLVERYSWYTNRRNHIPTGSGGNFLINNQTGNLTAVGQNYVKYQS